MKHEPTKCFLLRMDKTKGPAINKEQNLIWKCPDCQLIFSKGTLEPNKNPQIPSCEGLE